MLRRPKSPSSIEVYLLHDMAASLVTALKSIADNGAKKSIILPREIEGPHSVRPRNTVLIHVAVNFQMVLSKNRREAII